MRNDVMNRLETGAIKGDQTLGRAGLSNGVTNVPENSNRLAKDWPKKRIIAAWKARSVGFDFPRAERIVTQGPKELQEHEGLTIVVWN